MPMTLKKTTQDDAYSPSSFIGILIRYLDERGLEAPALKKRLDKLAANPRMACGDFAAALQAIHELDPVPALGLRIARMAKPENFGLVGYLLTSCSTLKQALIRYGRFQTLVSSNLNTEVQLKNDVVNHHWQPRPGESALSCEFSAAIFISLYQSLIGKLIAPVSVGLPGPKPTHTDIYEALLGCPVVFDCEQIQVDIPAHVLLLNISTSDPYLLKLFDRQAEAILNQQSEPSETSEQFIQSLQQHLLIAMKDGDTRASTIATQLGYPLRSFYRKLSEYGYSYRSILADTRQRQAKRYLRDAALSHAEVALLLGYSEQSAFIRAFKSWTGTTPEIYRAKKCAYHQRSQ